MSKEVRIRILVVGITCIVLLLLRIADVMAHGGSAAEACRNNLRQLDEAAAKYSLEAKGAPVSGYTVPLSGSNQVTAPQ